MSTTVLEEQINAAFASVPPPPVWSLADSREGDEPLLLEVDSAEIEVERHSAQQALDNYWHHRT